MTRRAYIQTMGCQMNEYDSGKIVGILEDHGYAAVDDPAEADLVILNTCSVREKAVHKVRSEVGRLRFLKSGRPGMLIGVAGCVAQQEGAALLDREGVVDLVFGPDQIDRLPEMLQRAERRERVVENQFRPAGEYNFIAADVLPGRLAPTAHVTVQKGCDNNCTFCIVPHTRGREINRPADEIVAEVRELARRGVREIILIGQNVNSYSTESTGGPDFPRLLEMAAAVSGVKRIRFTTSHPKSFDERLARAMAEIPQVCEFLHLPVQSGSGVVLEMMGREYTREDYLRKIRRAREICPTLSLSTDLIVGFPGELEEDFELTLSLVEEARFDSIFAFAYSPRPFTPAARFEDQVPEQDKRRRLATLLETARRIGVENAQALLGTEQEILIERVDARRGQATGRTRGNRLVHVDQQGLSPGDLVLVEITGVLDHSLRGRSIRMAA
ncbi:MAG: tRNA-2-methylthio-N(6)-dimethylallyladenosine synthase [Myxococcota bacterium]|nr:tRNA-2-methylthio-N(6)-dimethylallyladenosine synthase [Myxococcota bacterium]